MTFLEVAEQIMNVLNKETEICKINDIYFKLGE
jgi:hypothetical protein